MSLSLEKVIGDSLTGSEAKRVSVVSGAKGVPSYLKVHKSEAEIAKELQGPEEFYVGVEENIRVKDFIEMMNKEGRKLDFEGSAFPKGEDLTGVVSLEGVDMSNSIFHTIDFSNSNLSRANLSGSYFSPGSKANFTNFIGAELEDLNAEYLEANDANFSRANLSNADLENGTFENGLFVNANISEASLKKSSLEGADLGNADLRRTKLSDSNLSFANFSGADLSNAQFNEADITGAGFEGAISPNVKGAFYVTLSGLTTEQLEQVDKRSIW